MRKLPIVLGAVLCLGALALISCKPEPTPQAPIPLEGTEWVLSSLRGRDLVADSRITLNLGAEKLSGFSGCNEYGGEYESAEEGALLPSAIYRTEMLCRSPEGVMEQESSYFSALSGAATYRLAGDRLEIADAGGETVLVFTRQEEFATDARALVGTAWRLVSIDGASPADGTIITTVFFTDAVLGGHQGCRDYLQVYEARGDNLTVHLGSVFDAGCRPVYDGSQPEGSLFATVPDKADLQLAEGQLTIWGEVGEVLVYEPLPEEADRDLEGTAWSLMAFIGPNPYVEEPDPWPFPLGLLFETTIDLTLEGGAAQGSAGCNSYGASYSRSGSSLRFTALVSTKKACLDPEGLMKQETHYLELLDAVTAYHIYGDHLWLEAAEGQALVFFASAR